MMRTITIFALAVGLSGCVSFGAKPPPFLLNLSASTPVVANETRTAQATEAMMISSPLVPQAIATTRVAVMEGGESISYLKDAVWAETPARLFQNLLGETVTAKTGRIVLDARQFALSPSMQLSGSLKMFGVDAEAGDAVVIYEAALSRNQGETIIVRRFESRVRVNKIEPLPVARALNIAANNVAIETAVWLAE